jgi:pyridoxal biosynthesis lyase PdxS
MSDPALIKEIKKCITIPVMAKGFIILYDFYKN